MNILLKGSNSQSYNLGSGIGYSVQNVIDMAQFVTRQKINFFNTKRREGDRAYLVADSRLARINLGWNPVYHELSTVIEYAWAWEIKNS